MLGDILFWSGLAVSFAIGLLYFRDLGDVSQMLIKVKRKNMMRFIRNEYRLLAIGLAALGLATFAHFYLNAGPRGIWVAAILLCALLYGFPYIWVHVGLRNQKDSARYYSIEEAKEYVSPSSQVIVLENNGVARAHPQAQLMRPHLAGNDEGLDGENVVMTYCAMANLATHPRWKARNLSSRWWRSTVTTSSFETIKPGSRFNRSMDSARRMPHRRRRQTGRPARSGPRSR